MSHRLGRNSTDTVDGEFATRSRYAMSNIDVAKLNMSDGTCCAYSYGHSVTLTHTGSQKLRFCRGTVVTAGVSMMSHFMCLLLQVKKTVQNTVEESFLILEQILAASGVC